MQYKRKEKYLQIRLEKVIAMSNYENEPFQHNRFTVDQISYNSFQK